MQSVCVCTWPPAPCAEPPGCGCYSSSEIVCPAAPPAPPPAAAAEQSSDGGPASEPPSWPPTPRAPAPTPWTRPPEPHTEPRSHCSVPTLLHAGRYGMLAPPVFVLKERNQMCADIRNQNYYENLFFLLNEVIFKDVLS